jgi:hypothetical protein
MSWQCINTIWVCANTAPPCRYPHSTLQGIKAGEHWYFQGSINSVQQVITFCTALERRIAEHKPDQLDIPMHKPLNYVGYSMFITARGIQHDKGDTSWLQVMVLDAFVLEFVPGAFHYEGRTACFVTSEQKARVAESLLGTITDSNIETGGGFGVFQGGIEVISAKLLNKSSADE